MPSPDIEDWFLKLADEITRRWVIEAEPPKHFSASGAIILIVDALKQLGKKMREEPVVDTLADGTVVAQRPKALMITLKEPPPPPDYTVNLDSIEEPPQLPSPPNRHASLANLTGHLVAIVDEARLEPEVFDLAKPWTIDHLLERIAVARSVIDAIEYHARRVRKDPS